jgi:hypothetical protein
MHAVDWCMVKNLGNTTRLLLALAAAADDVSWHMIVKSPTSSTASA